MAVVGLPTGLYSARAARAVYDGASLAGPEFGVTLYVLPMIWVGWVPSQNAGHLGCDAVETFPLHVCQIIPTHLHVPNALRCLRYRGRASEAAVGLFALNNDFLCCHNSSSSGYLGGHWQGQLTIME